MLGNLLRSSRAVAIAAVAGVGVGVARADVETYLVQLQYNHEQSAAATVEPYSYVFYSSLVALPGDVGLARVASPGTAGEETMTQVDPGLFLYGELFTDESSLLDAYGAGFYTFSTSGGSTGFGFGDVAINFPIRYPSDVPAFDAATWTAMQSVDAAADLPLSFNTFTTIAPDARIAVQITVEATSAGVFYQEIPASQGTITIPAGTLQADERYQAALYFITEEKIEFAGFVSADSYSQIVYITVAELVTSTGSTCLADLNEDGIVDFADYLEFLNLYDAGDLRVDFNGDGLVDFSDYLEFLNLFDAGC